MLLRFVIEPKGKFTLLGSIRDQVLLISHFGLSNNDLLLFQSLLVEFVSLRGALILNSRLSINLNELPLQSLDCDKAIWLSDNLPLQKSLLLSAEELNFLLLGIFYNHPFGNNN